MDIVLGVERLGEFATAGLVPPGGEFPGLHPERHGPEQWRCGNLALVVAEPGVSGLDLALAHRVDDVERRHDFAGLEGFEDDRPVGTALDGIGYPNDVVAQHFERRGERNGNAPTNRNGHAFIGLRDTSRALSGWTNGQRRQHTDQKGDDDGDQGGPVGDVRFQS